MNTKHETSSNKAKTCTLLGLYLACLTSCAPTISGIIVDDLGQPVYLDGKINVLNLREHGSTQILDIKEDGSFETSGALTEGEYLVEPLIPGYEYSSKSINLDGSQYLEFKVSRRSTDKISTLKINSKSDFSKGAGDTSIAMPSY